jgi:hypothetical protein
LLASDDDYYGVGNRYPLIDVKALERQKELEDSESSQDYRGKNVGPFGYKEKKYAKPTDELRADIMNLFRQKEQWSWDEIKKSHLSDQPEAPLKK